MTAEWRQVVWRGEAFPDYLVSDDGRVIGRKGFELKQGPDIDGYPRVKVIGRSGAHYLDVHVLVCEAWHGPRPTPKHEVAHWDGNKQNNLPANLRWATKSENAADGIRLGEQPSGERSSSAKLTWADVESIRFMWAWGCGITYRELADQFGISRMQIGKIVRRVNWRDDPVTRLHRAELRKAA